MTSIHVAVCGDEGRGGGYMSYWISDSTLALAVKTYCSWGGRDKRQNGTLSRHLGTRGVRVPEEGGQHLSGTARGGAGGLVKYVQGTKLQGKPPTPPQVQVGDPQNTHTHTHQNNKEP